MIHFNVRKITEGYQLSGFFYDYEDANEVTDFLITSCSNVRYSIDYQRDNCFLWLGCLHITIADEATLVLLKLVSNMKIM